MTVVGPMSTHVRNKDNVQMCMRSTPVQVRDKHNRDINKVTENTKSGSYTVQRLTSPLHHDRRATIPQQQGKSLIDALPMFTVHLE